MCHYDFCHTADGLNLKDQHLRLTLFFLLSNIDRLHSNGVENGSYKILKNYLQNRKQRVVLN